MIPPCSSIATRRYEPGKARDTVFVVSHETAAPEQYGFSQSDERTDVYGAGRTLMFLACGSYHEKQLDRLRLSRGLRRVLRRAASAQPERRYAGAAALAAGMAVLCACLRPAPVGQAFSSFARNLTPGQSLSQLFGLDYHEAFQGERYQPMLDEVLACYALRDQDGLAASCESLVSALYADPGLLTGEKLDYAQVDPLPEDFFSVAPYRSISYGLWYGGEALRHSLGAYRDYAADFLRCLDDDLHAAALEQKTSSIYAYLQLPAERRGEVLDYTLSDVVFLLGKAIQTPPK